jgi:hypothetical protein
VRSLEGIDRHDLLRLAEIAAETAPAPIRSRLVLGRGPWDSPAVSDRPWQHSGDDDEQDGPLPAVVILEPGYGAELPLTSEEEGMLGWWQIGFSPNSWTS